MIANALFAATGLTLALIFFLGNELRFLIPYRFLLLHQHETAILLSVTRAVCEPHRSIFHFCASVLPERHRPQTGAL